MPSCVSRGWLFSVVLGVLVVGVVALRAVGYRLPAGPRSRWSRSLWNAGNVHHVFELARAGIVADARSALIAYGFGGFI